VARHIPFDNAGSGREPSPWAAESPLGYSFRHRVVFSINVALMPSPSAWVSATHYRRIWRELDKEAFAIDAIDNGDTLLCIWL